MTEIEIATRELIHRDFDLIDSNNQSELLEALRQAVLYLLLHNLEKLWNILYRIDVNETKVKALFEAGTPEAIAPGIANLIYKRLEEKAISRLRYRK